VSGRRISRLLLVGAVALGVVTATAAASPPRPADLRVVGGSDTWHADNRFALTWSNPVDGPPPAVTHYRLRDPLGVTIEEARLGRLSDSIAGLAVPSSPGSYSVEVWFEDNAGGQGPAAIAPLRFDDVRPAPVALEDVPMWIGRTSFPLWIRIGHPAAPPPISGIRGYAVSVGSDPGRAPCRAADRCTDAETTLRGGSSGDRLEIAALPQGTSYLSAVAVSGAGMKSATAAHAVLRVDTTDPVTQLSGVPGGWVDGGVSLEASATDAGAGMERRGGGVQPFTAIRVDGGVPRVAPGGWVATNLVEEGVHRIAYYASDAAGNVDDGAEVNGIPDRQPRAAWVRIDRTAPTVAFANAQDPRDPDLLQVHVRDALSGADPSRGRVGVRRAGSGDRFEPLPTSAAGEELHARWNSDAYPPGDYEFQATAYDSAGNASTTTRRRNGGPMVLSNPLKIATALRAGFRHHGLRRVVPYGRGIVVGGRLTAGRGLPLSDAPLRIVERFTGGTETPADVSSVRTGADGAISVRTAPGPSRTIEIYFDGSPTLTRTTAAPLELAVRSGVRLHASVAVAEVGGDPVVFRGRLLAPPGTDSAAGKSVQLQFRLPGLPWAEFRTVQTDRRGRFRYAYRFSDDDSRGARFQFRAYATAQENWPYEPGGSRPVLVRGR
jgi:hypothetical protein